MNGTTVSATALDYNGHLVWQTDICEYKVHQGYGASPALYKNLVLVATHEQRRSANARCQQIRLGTLRRSLGASLVNHEGQRLYRGDRVHFREILIVKAQKNREKIPRGTFGRITGVSTRNRSWRIKLDDGRELDIPCDVMRRDERKRIGRRQQKSKAEIALGYAVTTHASQGATIDRAFVLAGGSMQDRELTYVQASRARGDAMFFTTQDQAGEYQEDLKRTMSISHQKQMAIQVPMDHSHEM